MSNKTAMPAMKKTPQKPLTPKLRFPEFRGAEPWEETVLKDVLTEHKLKSDGRAEVHSVSVHKGVINQKEHLGRSFAAANTSNYNLVKPYDVIYTKSPTGDFPYGIVKYNHHNYNAIVSPLYGVFSARNRHLGYIFDAYFESPIRTGNYLAPITQKGAKNTIQISNETFLSAAIFLPPNEFEQQKIADCLTSLDELIAAEGQQLDALKAHKKGLMQQLFPQEGETTPHLRFPEFQEDEEWNEVSLSMIFQSLDAGVSVKSGDRPAGRNEVGILKTSSVTDGTFKAHENKVVLDETEQRRLKEPVSGGTIIISRMNTPELVGANAYIGEGVGNIFLPDRLWAAKPKAGMSMRFVAAILGSDRGRLALTKLATGTSDSMKNITKSDVLNLQISTPSLPEQQRIADCLASLDDLISAQSEKIETLKAHKKGLMQQLFPATAA